MFSAVRSLLLFLTLIIPLSGCQLVLLESATSPQAPFTLQSLGSGNAGQNFLASEAALADAEPVPQAVAARPVHLQIPKIGVDTSVESVSETAQGEMDVPKDTANAAWYNLGVRPGELGNAVISGHLDDYEGAAVFWDLDKLVEGDEVIVADEDGNVHRFEVIGSETYQFDEAPLDKIFGFDLEHDLNLITCNGSWDQSSRNYNKRLVVYARLIKS